MQLNDADDELVGELRRVAGAPTRCRTMWSRRPSWRSTGARSTTSWPSCCTTRAPSTRSPGCARRPRARAELRRGRPDASRWRSGGARSHAHRAARPRRRAQIEVRHAGGVTVEADARPLHRRGGAGRHHEPALPGPGSSRRGHAVASALTEATARPAALAAEAYRVVVDDPERARALAGEALRSAGPDADAAAAAHRALGMAALELDDADTAVAHLERAVRAGRRGGPQREAEARMSLALALLRRARPGARCARPTARRAHGVSDRGALQLQRAIILERLGRLGEALDGYRLATPASAAAGTATARRARSATAACSRPTAASSGGGGRPPARGDAVRRARPRPDERQRAPEPRLRRRPARRRAARARVLRTGAGDVRAIGGTRYALLELDRCSLLLAAGLTAEARASADRAITALVETAMARRSPRRGCSAGGGARRARLAGRAGGGGRGAARVHRPAPADVGRARTRRGGAGGVGRGRRRRGRDGCTAMDGARAPAARAARPPTSSAAAGRAGRPRAPARRPGRARARPPTGACASSRSRARTPPRAGGPADRRLARRSAPALPRDPAPRSRAVGGGLRALAGDRAALGATELRAHAAAQAEELADLGLRFALGRGRPAPRWRSSGRGAQTLHLAPVNPPRDPALAEGSASCARSSRSPRRRSGPGARRAARRAPDRLEHEIRRRLLQVPGTGALAPARAPTWARCARRSVSAR